MQIAQGLIGFLLIFLGVELACYWRPLLAVLFRARPPLPPEGKKLRFCILTACRDGADCIPGFVKTFQEQDYPAANVRQFLIADHCSDNSAALARSLGMEVQERRAPSVPGKGNAVNEVLQSRLREKPFDVMVLMDIDARVHPDFLKRAAAYFQTTPMLICCATYAKNPDVTLLSRVGTLIQGLLRLHQEGRAALGQDALIFGSHGCALSWDALEALEWHTTTGLVAEDMELRLRSTLQHLPIRYAPDLPVYNDVTIDAASVHQQRLRWNAIYPPLIARYFWPLFKQAQVDALLSALLLPTFANLFLYLTLLTLGLAALAWKIPAFQPYALTAGILWTLDVLYFFTAFHTLKERLSLRDLIGFIEHLGIRAFALVGGLFRMHVIDWAPAPHPVSKEDER